MIAAVPPFNIIAIPLIPYLLYIKDDQMLIHINAIILRVMYTPVAILSVIVFFVLSCCLVPFAYLKALFHKIILCKRFKKQ